MAPPFFKTFDRACAVVLASSRGSRLFPMTTKDNPKHLLPVAGVPSIVRLVSESLSAFSQIVVTITEDDTQTLSVLLAGTSTYDSGNHQQQQQQQQQQSNTGSSLTLVRGPDNNNNNNNNNSSLSSTSWWELKSELKPGQRIYVVKLSADDCYGSADALRIVEGTKLIDPRTRMVVFPGDLVILRKNLGLLEPLIRPVSDDIACTIILVDGLEQDENGLPLKESAKSKRGGLSRDKEDIEYIALSFPTSGSSCSSLNNRKSILPRIVLKKSLLSVEEDDMTGSTPKLVIPKTRLRGRNGNEEKLVIRTEWSDVHVYAVAPWVRQLIVARKRLSSIKEDLLPLLISRQYRGKRLTFGKVALSATENNHKPNGNDPIVIATATGTNGTINDNSYTHNTSSNGNHEEGGTEQPKLPMSNTIIDDAPYSVVAVVLPAKASLRINTVSAYLSACKEAVANGGVSDTNKIPMPPGSKHNVKFQTLTLDGTNLGSKINMKSSTVGKSCTLGDKCRLNNVVIMDDVTIGEQCSLQNTLIGYGAKVGNNCSLNDCQVGPGMDIPSGTKAKGEPFMATSNISCAICP